MNQAQLDELLDQLPHRHVLVVGDFFLDEYLIIDRQLSEISLETNLEAHQVIDVRCSPGAAGTVVSNLRALGVKVSVLGIIGDDGRGHDLKRGLLERGADVEPLIERAAFLTSTYTKPMVHESDGRIYEIQRLDIKNRFPLSADLEDAIIDRLRRWVPQVDGVIVVDQIPEPNCGVVTDRVRAEIGALAVQNPEVVFAADSRIAIGLYRHVIIKPNAQEAILAVHPDWTGEIGAEVAKTCGAELFRQNQMPVFLTLGDQGMLLFTAGGCEHIPAVTVNGEIDIVGAGDSVMAAIVSALCSGAEPKDAAMLGNLVASITIQQIGTTGTATPSQVREQFGRISQDE